MRRIILFLLLGLVPLVLIAESLYGRVIDSGTLKGIADVSVSIKGEKQKTVTDQSGMFSFEGLNERTYSVYFRHIGFTETTQKFTLPQNSLQVVQLKRKTHHLEGVTITETRAEQRKTPVAHSNISQQEINKNLQGQDLPLILDEVPGIYSYSESGSGAGYSYMKLRGFDQKRIGVMINGIPLNDPEDHSVYWIDMPDFAESIQDIQVQRGVGASRYGIASFGGTVNINTVSPADEYSSRYNQLYALRGSYNTHKYGIKFFDELADNVTLNVRLSRIISDGYRDNSASELTSLYTSVDYKTPTSITTFNFYTGHEITHAAWYASWEGDLQNNHQHNPIEYENEIDDFEQPHWEIHNLWRLNDVVQFKNSLFYIKGKGYYEQQKNGADLWSYGLADSIDAGEADIVRQKWVEKNQAGWVGNLSIDHKKGDLSLGSYISFFNSDHWGEVENYLNCPVPADFEQGSLYYNYLGKKNYFTFYLNENLELMPELNVMANLHYQLINYEFEQKEAGNYQGEYLNRYKVDYAFLNPQIGMNYNLNKNWNAFASVSMGHREPADSELYDTWDGPDDLGVEPLFENKIPVYDHNGQIAGYKWTDPMVVEEKVIDYELGIGYINQDSRINLNGYYMDFQNEIVDYGGVDDAGNAVRGNADATIHRGVELEVSSRLSSFLQVSGSCAWSDNYFQDFEYTSWDGSVIDLSGNTLAGFPEWVAQAKISYIKKYFNLFLQGRYSGKQYLDNTQNEEHIIDDFIVWNLGMSFTLYNFIGNTSAKIELRVNNIFDLEYETAGYLDDADGDWAYDDNHYFPAAGRNLSAGLRLMY